MAKDFQPDKKVRLRVTVLHSLPLTRGNKVACTRALVTAAKAVKELDVVGPKNVHVSFKPREGDRHAVLARVLFANPISAKVCVALIFGAHEALSSVVRAQIECEVVVP